ncbi:MAG: phosphate/phosphite/phosphonate ABC transporter substrate-binding protein [Anaerolineales bacterium]|nr:phosphate/phosphite/phosphonate ABC transporter substrate-binding protein [Anaerolineales bacterium]
MKKIVLFVVAMFIVLAVIAACAPAPTPTPVPVPALGSKERPIIITFVPSGDTAKIAKAGDEIADFLAKNTGLTFAKPVQVGTSFAASIEAMGANKAHVGFLNTFSVLLAREKYQIEPILAVLRKYNTNAIDPDKAEAGKLLPYYKGQFITKKDSGIKTYADLKGKTFCFVDPNSTSGYIIPRIILMANGINPDKDLKAVVNAGSHNNVGLGVYKGDCDAGVSYVDVMTDAAANLAKTFPDIAEKVVPFAITDRIPCDGVQVVKGMDPKVKAAVQNGLAAMAKDPDGNKVLRSLYTIDGFEKIDIKFYDDFLAVLKKAGIDPATLVK